MAREIVRSGINHVVMCMHASRFWQDKTCFLEQENLDLKGQGFNKEANQIPPGQVCSTVPQEEIDVSILLLLFHVFYPIPFRAHARRKQNGIPFQVLALLPSHITLMLPHIH